MHSSVDPPGRALRTRAGVVALVMSAAALLGGASMGAGAISSCTATGESFAGGSGTSAHPYEVATAAQLAAIRTSTYRQCAFTQTADIALSGEWTPIGISMPDQWFSGEYDGGGHAITGLSITSGTSFAGLFGYVRGGILRDLTLAGTLNAPAATYVAPLAGLVERTAVTNVHSSADVTGYSLVGGLIARVVESSIARSSSTGTVSGPQNTAGGLIGQARGTNDGITTYVSDSYARGAVSSSDASMWIAGLIGGIEDAAPGVVVTNSYATGAVTGGTGSKTDCFMPGMCFTNYGTTGGLVAPQYAGDPGTKLTVTASFWDTEATGRATSLKGTGKTTAQMKSFATFDDAGWDIANGWSASKTWGICDGSGYPFLSPQYTSSPCAPTTTTLYVVADDETVTYGASAPTYGYHLYSDSGHTTTASAPAGWTPPTCTSTYTSAKTVSDSGLAVTCAGAFAGGYAFDYTDGSVTINKASTTTAVTCPSSAVTYAGAAQTPCTASVTGAGGLSLTPTPTYTDNTAAGTATANSTYAGDANYSDSSDSDTFTIDPAPAVQVSADDKDYARGTTPPTLTYGPSGFVGGQSFASPGMTAPTCRAYTQADTLFATPLTLTASTAVGTYVIRCSGAVTSANYVSPVTYSTGTLTVRAASVTPAYTGPQWLTTTGTSASAKLTAAVTPPVAGCNLAISLDPGSGSTLGPYSATTDVSGAISKDVSGIPVGIYQVTASTTAGGCAAASDSSFALAVVPSTIGKGSTGGGWYRATTSPPRVSVAYQVQVTQTTPKVGPATTTTQGQVLWVTNAGWRLKSGIKYSATDGTTAWGRLASCPATQPNGSAWPYTPACGQISYTGLLQKRDPVTGLWADSSYGTVRYTLTVYDGGQTTVCKTKTTCTTTSGPDWGGIQLWTSGGTPITTAGEPTLAMSAPMQLAGGQIKVF